MDIEAATMTAKEKTVTRTNWVTGLGKKTTGKVKWLSNRELQLGVPDSKEQMNKSV